jgi:hypothetical protein
MELKNIKKAKELLEELENLEDILDVANNYDATCHAKFHSAHNNNKNVSKTRFLELPKNIVDDLLKEHIPTRIYEIKKELETL